MPTEPPPDKPLSETLIEVAATAPERVTVEDLVAAMGRRSFGIVLVGLALPAWIPVLPPGIPSLFGAAIAAVAIQMLAGRDAPWLPGFIRRRNLSAARLRRLVRRAVPWLRRVEGVSRPRLAWLFSTAGRTGGALWLLILALVICVPFPMTNSGPALSIAVIGLGLVQRDGLLLAAGAILGLLSIGVAVVFWGGAAFLIDRLLSR